MILDAKLSGTQVRLCPADDLLDLLDYLLIRPLIRPLCLGAPQIRNIFVTFDVGTNALSYLTFCEGFVGLN